MPSSSMTLLAASVLAAVVGCVVAGIVRRVALERGVVVPPRPDRWHREPTPTYGGVGVLFGLFAGAAIAGGLQSGAWPVLLAGIALFIVGWFDDVMPMSALAKMVSTLAVAAFFVFTLANLREASPGHAVLTIVAILWVGGLVNAINLLDNMDGLAGGASAIAAVGLALTFGAELGSALVALLLALAGGLLGFLVWNTHPARIFLGNCGSLAVGGLIAAAATVAIARAGTFSAAAAAALILIVPIFDSTFVILLRRLAGRSTTRGNIDHTSHRLVSAGFSDRTAVGILYLLGLVGAVVGYWVHAHPTAASPVAAAVAIAVLLVGLSLARVAAYEGQDFKAIRSVPFAPLLSDLTFRWHAGEVVLDLVLIATCYYAAYRIRFEGDADLPVFMRSFALSLPAIVGCQLAALYVSGLYKRVWSTFGLHDFSTVLRAVVSGVALSVLTITYLYKFGEQFSRSVFLIYAALLTLAIVGTRSSFRVFTRAAARRSPRRRRVAVYGAGTLGQLLVREMLANDAWGLTPVAFLDDDEGKLQRRMIGVPVRGSAANAAGVIEKHGISEVIISSRSIGPDAEARLRLICNERGVRVRRLSLQIK